MNVATSFRFLEPIDSLEEENENEEENIDNVPELSTKGRIVKDCFLKDRLQVTVLQAKHSMAHSIDNVLCDETNIPEQFRIYRRGPLTSLFEPQSAVNRV